MRKTLLYYDKMQKILSVKQERSILVRIQELFLSKLEKGALILDFGCGSGRDTKCFLNRGYFVEAVDGLPRCVGRQVDIRVLK